MGELNSLTTAQGQNGFSQGAVWLNGINLRVHIRDIDDAPFYEIDIETRRFDVGVHVAASYGFRRVAQRMTMDEHASQAGTT
jgi:hypothetical protein